MRLIKIGRDASCNITLPSPRVSALHAEMVFLNNGDILLEDKGSTHGTTVNGTPIAPGKSVSVRRGDRVTFADTSLNWNDVPPAEDNSAYDAIYGIGSNFRNEIRLNGDRVSRFHATLKHGKDKKWYLQDHSKNGTLINGVRIASGQNVRLKKGDTVSCAGQTLDLSNYTGATGGNGMLKWGAIGICAAAVIAVLVMVLPALFAPTKNFTQSTAYVVHAWHFTVTLEDDPIAQVFKDNGIDDVWPDAFEFGVDSDGDIQLIGDFAQLIYHNPPKADPFMVEGTAFFVDEQGRMVTNRHMAAPWEFSDLRPKVNEAMGRLQQELPDRLSDALLHILFTSKIRYRDSDIQNWITKLRSSKFTISGTTDRILVGLPEKYYSTFSEFMPASVRGMSEKKEIDVAVIQLNNRNTPTEVRDHIIDLKDAIVDKSQLKLGMPFVAFGYPAGLYRNLDNDNNKGLTPQMYHLSLSRVPGRYDMEMQGQALPGSSGSPVLTPDGKLVGVIDAAVMGTTISQAVLARYVIELYNKTVSDE